MQIKSTTIGGPYNIICFVVVLIRITDASKNECNFFDHYKQSSGPEVIKLFPRSTELSMKFFLLINLKMPTIVGTLTFMSMKNRILD